LKKIKLRLKSPEIQRKTEELSKVVLTKLSSITLSLNQKLLFKRNQILQKLAKFTQSEKKLLKNCLLNFKE